MDQPDLTQPKYCTCANLRMAARTVTQMYEEFMKASPLRGTQFTVLATLSAIGQTPLTKLAEVLGMDRTTLTRNLKPLEKQGLIESQVGEDRRERLILLTAKGEAAYAKALPLWEQAQSQLIDTLGEEKLSALLEILVEVRMAAS